MKFYNLLFVLPITLAQCATLGLRGDSPITPTPETCCPADYKNPCTQSQEQLFHAKLFYKRKNDITAEQFDAYWANNHTALVTPFHLRLGVVKYVQYHSNPALRDLLRAGGLPILEFDGAAEFWVRDIQTLADMQTDEEYVTKVKADEAKFIDLESLTMTVGVDYVVVDNHIAVEEHGRTFEA